MKLTVLRTFHDKYNNRIIYSPGDMIDFEDQERIDSLLERGLAEIVPDVVVFNAVNINQSATKIKDEVDACTDIEELENALNKEKADKNRSGVIKMLNERIKEIR